MKIKNIFLSVVLLGTTLASCVSDKEYEYDENFNRSIVVSAQIASQDAKTRAAGTAWNENDEIGMFMKNAGSGLAETAVVDNAENKRYVTPSGNGIFNAKTGTDGIFFPQDNSLVDFVAYYPYSTTVKTSDNPAKYIFDVNVANQTSQSAIDLMYSTNAVGHKNGDAVSLTFNHKLTKVVFEIEGINGVTSMNGMKVEIENMLEKAKFDLATGVLTPEGSPTTKLTMKTTMDAQNPLKAVSEGIVIPTAAAARNFIFTVEVAGVSKSFPWDATTQPFEAGKKNTYRLKLDGQLGAIVSPGSTINDWENGSNEDIEIEIGGGTVVPGDGTQGNPFNVEEAGAQVGQTAKWVTGYILGSSSKTKSLGAATKDNIVLATKAGETDEAKWIIIDLVGSSVQDNLDIVTNPTLVGKKVKVQGNVVNTLFGGVLSMTTITAQEGGAEVTDPEPSGSLVFPGSDFENWTAFLGGLTSHGLQSYAVQNTTGGRNGSAALHLKGSPGGNDYVFTSNNATAITTSPTKISFYVKGTAAKTLSLNVYTTDTPAPPTVVNYKTYNVGNLSSADVIIEVSPNNQYVGTIDTKGQWVKVTLNISSIPNLQKAAGQTIFALKVGRTAAYDLLVDDIVFE